MMTDPEEFTVQYVTHTPDGILIEDLGQQEWLPRSQIEEEYQDSFLESLERGEEIDITIPKWLAIEKGLI